MNSIRHSRGHELPDHCKAKLNGRQMMCDAGFDLVVCEFRNADVVGIRRIGGRLRVVTVEFERTVRNLVQNIRRNLANGSDFVLEVCMVSSVKGSAQRLIGRTLTAGEQDKVQVVAIEELTVDLLHSLSGKPGVDSGCVPVNSRVDSTGIMDRSG